jgi:hypothetical protein
MARAREQLDTAMAHWEGNCLKLECPRRWKPRISGGRAAGAVMVWQLVA